MKTGLAIDAEGKEALRAVSHALLTIDQSWTLAVEEWTRDHVRHRLQGGLQQNPLVLLEEFRPYQSLDLGKFETVCTLTSYFALCFS